MASKIEELKALNTILKETDSILKDVAKSAAKALEGGKVESSLKGVRDTSKAIDELKKSNDALASSEIEQAKIQKQLIALTDEEVKGKIKYQKANKEQKDTLGALLVLEDKESGTLQKLAARNTLLRKEREKLNLKTLEGQKRLKEINTQLDKNNDKIKQNSDQLKKQKINVGNYEGAIGKLTPILGGFGSKLNMIHANLVQAREGFKGMGTAQETAGKGSKLLSRAMLAIPIFAIIGAISALIAAFAGTQRGMDALRKVIEPVKAVFEVLLGVVQDLSFKAFDKLKEAINNPAQAFKDLGKIIVDNVLNRFKAFSVFLEAIQLAMKGEFSAAFKKGTDAVIQLGTGITDATDKISDGVKEVKDLASAAVDLGNKIADLKIQLQINERDTIVPLAKMRLEFQKLREVAQDQTKSEYERIKALSEAERLQKRISDTENGLLKTKIQIMELEQSKNDTTREEEIELQKLKAELLNNEAAAQKKINGLVSLRTGLEKRLAMEQQKRIDAMAKEEEERYNKGIENIQNEWKEREKAEKDLQKLVKETSEDEEIYDLTEFKDYMDERKKMIEDEAKLRREYVQKLASTTLDSLKTEAEAKQRFYDAEVDQRQASLTAQQQLGVRNTVVEEQLLAEAQLKKQQQLERQAEIDKAIQLKDAYFGFLQARISQNPDGASARALGDVAQAEAFAKLIGAVAGFKDGGYTGDVGINDIAGVTHGKEFVIDAPTTQALGLKGADMGSFKDKLYSGNLFEPKETNISKNDDRLYNEVKKLNENISNKKEQFIDVDKLGNYVERLESARYRESIIHKRNSRRW